MTDNTALGDLLSGAAGHPINRPALEAAVIQGQALAGLRTAQTENSLLQAMRMREEQDASDQLEGALLNAKDPSGNPLFTPSQAKFTATQMKFLHGGSKEALEGWNAAQKAAATATLGDVAQLGTPAQTAAQQALKGEVATPFEIKPESGVLPGAFQPDVLQTPGGIASTEKDTQQARLYGAQADAGGFNPNTGMGWAAQLGPEQYAALDNAIREGRLDPARLNSRTALIYAEIEARSPGTNFNRMIADAALQRNATFQQRAMTMEALPTVLSHMTSLGKKIGYSDNRTIGRMQAFMQGEFNDPDYAEYMSLRNDALMNIANVMRGVGMSDQAHRAEIEAAAPTMSPLALDGWLKGQMSALKPRLDQFRRVQNLGDVTPTKPGIPDQSGAGGEEDTPPINLLQEGHTTTFDNGQSWTLRNGKAVRVK